MKKYNLEVIIENIEVDDRYYSFDYTILLDSKEIQKDKYSNDYCNGDTKEQFKKLLEDGYALELALEDFSL